MSPDGGFGPLYASARRCLEGNVVTVGSRAVLVAGQHQFRSLWTRDFCFAARGLLALGRVDVVRDHVTLLLTHRRERDALIPRLMDSTVPGWWRVVRYFAKDLVSRTLPWRGRGVATGGRLREPLHPEYRSEHRVEAIDSNLLVFLTAVAYLERTSDTAWWDAHEPRLLEVLRHYERHRDPAGLLRQGAFTDWQDSVRREGRTFYTNLLQWRALSAALRFPRLREGLALNENGVAALRQKLHEVFFDADSGLYRSLEGAPHISLDGNLLALDLGFAGGGAAEPRALFESLRAHPLWRGSAGMPGFVTVPDYPHAWLAPHVKLGRIHRYHDQLYWSWLMALSAKVARAAGEHAEAERILARLDALARRDGTIHEVYAHSPALPPFESWIYRSESHFSWGAGMLLDALA
jgi:hypothetical protein